MYIANTESYIIRDAKNSERQSGDYGVQLKSYDDALNVLVAHSQSKLSTELLTGCE